MNLYSVLFISPLSLKVLRYGLCVTVHGTAPDYLSELCRSNTEDAARSRLR